MMEQAGSDRVLFMNTKPQEFVDMKFPEYVAFLRTKEAPDPLAKIRQNTKDVVKDTEG